MRSFWPAAVLALTLQNSALAQDAAKQIARLMEQANAIGVFNGNVLAASKGEIVYQGSFGYADASKSTRLAPDYAFYLGSIDKEFNGSGLLLLEQQGKIRLQDKVSKYLPGYPAWADRIELGQLINYTSGLPDVTDDALLQLKELKFAPGTAYLYSNTNVSLQKKIIEQVTGLSYEKFLKTQVFGPCGVTNVASHVALPFTDAFQAVDFDPAQNRAALATASDLYHWTACLSNPKFLTEQSLEILGKSFGGAESSLGNAQFKNGALSTHDHQGSGFNNEGLLYDNADENIIVILLTNNQNFKLYPLKDAVVQILHGQPYQLPKKSIYLDIREGLAANFQEGMAAYQRLRQSGKDIYDFANEPFGLLNTGRYLSRRQKFDDAIAMFELGITFPLKANDLSYGYELIAGAWSDKGNKAMAMLYYQKALDADASNKNARGMLDQLKGR